MSKADRCACSAELFLLRINAQKRNGHYFGTIEFYNVLKRPYSDGPLHIQGTESRVLNWGWANFRELLSTTDDIDLTAFPKREHFNNLLFKPSIILIMVLAFPCFYVD